ncbi:MAG TPA: hypothetical protein VGF56_12525 [Rhizomicrobium sp.]|jgi:hypothetical protein
MFSYWAYILVARNNKGKTTIQRHVARHLCGIWRPRLPVDAFLHVNHDRAPKGLNKLFLANRSLQERKHDFPTVDSYFGVGTGESKGFKDADLCVLSSHSGPNEVKDVNEMIRHLKRRCYNVSGVFFRNDDWNGMDQLTMLPWTEVLWIDNKHRRSATSIEKQLADIGLSLSNFLIARSHVS